MILQIGYKITLFQATVAKLCSDSGMWTGLITFQHPVIAEHILLNLRNGQQYHRECLHPYPVGWGVIT